MGAQLEPQLSRMVAAFRTNEQVERTVRRQQKRDPALIQLADEIHEQRVRLARELRDFLHASV